MSISLLEKNAMTTYTIIIINSTVSGTKRRKLMIATKQVDVRANIKKYFDIAIVSVIKKITLKSSIIHRIFLY